MVILAYLIATLLGVVGHLATGALMVCLVAWLFSDHKDARTGTILSAMAFAGSIWGIYFLGMRYDADSVWLQFTVLGTQFTVVSWHVLAPLTSMLFWAAVLAWVFYHDIYVRKPAATLSTTPTEP